MSKGPLDGINVLEMTQYYNGPYAGRMLGELGASVIKIEPPWGDPQRNTPPLIGDSSLHFIFYNANKKFITLNLKTSRGKEIFFELLKDVDVFIENYTPGTLDKLGIGYTKQKEINPGIIYCSSSAYGEGPYRDLPGFDPVVQAFSGLMDTNGFPGKPTRLGTSGLDIVTPVFADLAIVSALRLRDKTGKGQKIDIAMYDVAVLMSQQSMVYHLGGYPVRTGPTSFMVSPEYLFETKDGLVYVIIHTEDAWTKLVKRFNRSDLLDDERFKGNERRVQNREILVQLLSGWFSNITSEHLAEIINEVGGVCGIFRETQVQLNDPETLARNMYPEFVLPSGERVKIPGSAFKLNDTPGIVKTPGLPKGFHNEEVYMKILGLTKDELNELKKTGVI